MKKQYKKALAAVLAVSLAWNLIPNIPYAHASQTSHYIVDDIETLPDDIMYQQVEFGTKKKDLELPNKLEMLVRPDDEEDWDAECIETASSSNAGKATPSDAERTDEDEDETATPSTATSSDAEDTNGDWKMVRVEWVLNERFSEAEEYDGEQPGIYVFDAEFVNDRYSVGDALLPTIEVEVLEEVQEQPVKRAPLAVQEQVTSGTATITAFTGLSDEVKAQELAIGASETEITLPETLKVTFTLSAEDSIDDGAGAETDETGTSAAQIVENVELAGITWKIDSAKSSTAEFSSAELAAGNTYTYVPVLPETVTLEDVEYTLELGEEAKTPEITVTIGEKANNVTVARVEKNGETEEFSDITKAFESVAAGETATITLLNNVEADITVSGNVTLTNEGDKEVEISGTVTVPSGASLTLAGDALTIKKTSEGVVNGVYVDGGRLVVEKGTIEVVTTGSSGYSYGVAADYGTVEIHGGSIIAEDTVNGRKGYGIHVANSTLSVTAGTISGSSIGLSIASDNVSLSGGTFTAEGDSKRSNAIWINTYFTSRKAGGMLKKGFVYYDAGGAYAAGVNSTADSFPAGTYTIGACKDHSYGAWSSADSKVHTRICEYCGTEETTETHQFGEDGKCTVEGCTAQASAGVTVNGQTEYYTDISAAFSAASTAGTKAEVKLLADIDYGSWSYISVLSGDVTLDLNGYTLTGKNQNQVLFLENCQMTIKDSSNGKTGVIRNMNGKGVFVRSGASLTMENGRIETNPESEGWVSGTAINVAWGGSLTIYDGELDGYVGVHLDEGSVTIHGGSISGSWYAVREINKQDNVTLYGGTYTGGLNTKNMTFSQILGTGSAYYSETTGSYLTEGLDQIGDLAVGETVSIKAAPVQITDGPEDLNLSYGFASGTARLQVTAVKGEAVEGELSYQWYQVSTEDGGTDKTLTDSEGGYSGSQTGTLILPDSWVSGGSGSFYCVVSCGSYSVSSGTAQVEITVCPHSQVTDGVCQGCGRIFKASVSDGTDEASYYETFEDAWEAAQGRTAEVRLLANAEVETTLTVTDGSNITLASGTDSSGNTYTLSGNVFNASSGLINIVSGGTLTLESGTVENGAGGNNAIAVNGGHFVLNGGTAAATANGHSGVCVYNVGTAEIRTGNVSGDIGVAAASDGSTITILDGTISGRASGVYVSGSGAKITITGGSISASNTEEENGADGAALRIQSSGSALLSGGIYSGVYGILIDSKNSITLKELLDVGGDVKYAYYSNGVLLTEGLDGKTLTGSLTVGKCEHSYSVWTANEDGKTHSGTCVVCGDSISADHSWGENGKCTAEGCMAQAAASVKTGDSENYYSTIEEAWTYAQENSSDNSPAVVTLLTDVEVTKPLTISNGNITLVSREKDDGSSYTISGNIAYDSRDAIPAIVHVTGGTLTFQSGSIDSQNLQGEGIRVTAGTLIVRGGMISAGGEGILVASSDAIVNIEDGNIYGEIRGISVSAGGDVNLSGGTFSSGDTYGKAVYCLPSTGKTIAALLEIGFAYRQDSAWVNDTTATEMTGTVTVEEAPIKSVEATADKKTVTATPGWYENVTFTAQAELSGNYTDLDVTWKWFQDGMQIANEKEWTYYSYSVQNPGKYTYICEAICDGYTVTSKPFSVTVVDPNAETISVDVIWGAMEFTYTDGAWNPETHTYKDGGWTAADSGDQITVKNNGKTDVTVSYSYEKTEIDISGSFADETGQTVAADTPIALPVDQERKTYLKLSGKPASGFTTGTLGTVKVTIGGEE